MPAIFPLKHSQVNGYEKADMIKLHLRPKNLGPDRLKQLLKSIGPLGLGLCTDNFLSAPLEPGSGGDAKNRQPVTRRCKKKKT